MRRDSPICHVVVDANEFMTDAIAVLSVLRLTASVAFDSAPFAAALAESHARPTLVISGQSPTVSEAIACGERNQRGTPILAMTPGQPRSGALAPLLGLPTFSDIPSAIAAIVMVARLGVVAPTLSARSLPNADRVRLTSAVDGGTQLARLDDGLIGIEGGEVATYLGRIDDVNRALVGLALARHGTRPSLPRVEDADRSAALEVLMGPERTLSDPASKAALEAYDLPLPVEEFCATASRAASESARMGFPVRIALASPELRASEHPDLVVSGVEGATRVRETFRELQSLAERKSASARVLGVTVSVSTHAHCVLHIRVERIAATRLTATIGFADPHARATGDAAQVILPATADEVQSTIASLRGASLLAAATGTSAGTAVDGLTDIVLRLAAFMDDFPLEVGHVLLDPVAVLTGGEVEIREAQVRVTNAFTARLG